MLKLKSRVVGPPGGFRYICPETGKRIDAVSWVDWWDKIKAHRKANNLPIGLNFEEEVEHRLCETLPPESCGNHDMESLARAERLQGGMTLSNVVQGTLTLGQWFLTGMERSGSALANARAKTCVQCHFNQDVPGCMGCNNLGQLLKDAIVTVVGGEKTDYDSRLKSCAICKCANAAKVQLPLSTILAHTPADQLKDLPENCWILTEQKATT